MALSQLKRPEELRDIMFGEDTFFVEGRSDYVIRQPVKYGFLNISSNYSVNEALIDLELLTREAIKDLGFLAGADFREYTVILCVPDLFHRGQYKRVIDMLMKNLGFGRFFIHVQSVMAAYGGALNPCCVVNIGHTCTTVAALEDGVVIPESVIYKQYGIADIDLVLMAILEAKKAVAVAPENSQLESSKHKMMAYFERIREQFGSFSC